MCFKRPNSVPGVNKYGVQEEVYDCSSSECDGKFYSSAYLWQFLSTIFTCLEYMMITNYRHSCLYFTWTSPSSKNQIIHCLFLECNVIIAQIFIYFARLVVLHYIKIYTNLYDVFII